ncbi:HTTM domain-containing protein [Mammaliicoccus lentus]|uniref:HTTM domain-containing protein n=1 Tax=Mammaliicoccus lentus TaxID=42858 RepID=A0AAX3W377_MAMLE|nr:sporulation-delaying protein SdpB family protein [Mammaliicoccus lentus]WHI59704.1 HTTM domain-containing protein [Mammaliicoccus lentus]
MNLHTIKETIISYNPWTNVYGLARSIIGLAMLLTLIFNSTNTLMIMPENVCNLTVPTAFCLVSDTGITFELVRYVFIIILLLVVIGWRPRITGILHFYIAYSLHGNAILIDGGEHIASVITFWLIPITLCDSRKWHWEKVNVIDKKYISKKLIPLIFFKFIEIQVAIIYINAAIARLNNPEWVDGTALYYFLTDTLLGYPTYQAWILEPLLTSNIVAILTWGTTIIEFILFAGFFASQKNKIYILTAGIILHLGIALVIGIVTFSMVMIGSLILYLYPKQKHIEVNSIPFLKGGLTKRLIKRYDY